MLDHEVVSEGADDRTDMRYDPRDPEEVVSRAERLLAEPGNEGEEAAAIKLSHLHMLEYAKMTTVPLLTARSPSRD